MVWIGTSSAGIACFDQKTGQFRDYNVENGKLKNNNIYAVAQDSAGNVWVGTKGGLHYIDLARDTTLLYTEADGLSNASIAGIEIDDRGNLWIKHIAGTIVLRCEKPYVFQFLHLRRLAEQRV